MIGFPAVGPLGSNYVPTQLQHDETRGRLLKAQEEIKTLDSEIAGLKLATEVAEHAKQKLERVVKAYLCFVSPIRRVPSEIWHEIFLLVVSQCMDTSISYLDFDALHASNLQRVCCHWADIIESSPRLWSYATLEIGIHFADQLKEQRLQLAKGSSLHVRLCLPQVPRIWTSPDPYSCESCDPEWRIDWDKIDHMIGAMVSNMNVFFASHGSQCQELCLADLQTPWLSVLSRFPVTVAQHLERLYMTSSLISRIDASAVLQNLTLAKFPRLRHVALSSLTNLPIPTTISDLQDVFVHVSSLHLTSMYADSVLKTLSVCQALDSVTLNELDPGGFPLVDAALVCNIRSFTTIGNSLSVTAYEQLFCKLILPRLSRIELISDYGVGNHSSYHPQSKGRQYVSLLGLELMDLLARSRCPLTSMSLIGVSIKETPLLSIFRLTPGLTTLILRGRYIIMTEKIIRSLVYDPTSTEGPLLPRLTELEAPVCTSLLDALATLIESRRPSDFRPSSAPTIDYLTRALVAPCGCESCVDFAELNESISQRVNKLRQSGLRMSLFHR